MSSSPRLGIGQSSCPFAIADPVAMPGFAARTERSTGMLTPPPGASAVAVEDVVLVSLDVLGTEPALSDEIAAQLPDSVSVLVASTHTHSGPAVTPGRLGVTETPARPAVVGAAVTAARRALASRAPSSLEWMAPVVPGLARDRRSEGMPVPQARLTALRWRRGDEVRGWLVSYPCHPTVIGPASRLLSPDYPGWLRAALEKTGGTAVFLTGCAGELNAGHQVTASFHLDPAAGRTPDDAARFGESLARAVLAAEWRPVPAAGGVQLRTARVDAAYGPLTRDDPRRQREVWQAELAGADAGTRALLTSWIAWAERPDAGSAGRYPLPVALLGLGEAELVLLPGEPFLSADLALRGDGPTMVVGYYCDVPGYLPSSPEYSRGGYEVLDAHRYYGMPAPFAPGTLERLVDEVDALRARRSRNG